MDVSVLSPQFRNGVRGWGRKLDSSPKGLLKFPF